LTQIKVHSSPAAGGASVEHGASGLIAEQRASLAAYPSGAARIIEHAHSRTQCDAERIRRRRHSGVPKRKGSWRGASANAPNSQSNTMSTAPKFLSRHAALEA